MKNNMLMNEAEKNAAAAAYAWTPIHNCDPCRAGCVIRAAVYQDYRRFFNNTVFGGYLLGTGDLSNKTLDELYDLKTACDNVGLKTDEFESIKGLWSL